MSLIGFYGIMFMIKFVIFYGIVMRFSVFLVGLLSFCTVYDIHSSFDEEIEVSDVMQETAEFGKIIATCIAAASWYGIAQDQITYRHCPEYFTKGFHKEMMDSWSEVPGLAQAKKLFDENPDNPTLRATIWGVVASWWMGALIGIPVSIACRVGSWPKMNYKDIIKPLGGTLSLTGMSALIAGTQAKLGRRRLMYDDVEDKKGFYKNLIAHQAAYIAGPIWSLGLIAYILRTRYQLSQQEAFFGHFLQRFRFVKHI